MPVAYGIAAVIGGSGLIIRLNMKIKFIDFSFILEILKIISAAAIMFIAARFVRGLFEIRIMNLIVPALTGVIVYFASAYVLKISALQRTGKT
jgi:hypothetical protein